MKKILASIHPDDDLHYKKLGLTRKKIELWEDGMRTDGSRGTYEWWYFDSSYPDGTKLVIIFFSKSPIEVNGPIHPIVTADLTLPDGTSYSEQVEATLAQSSYAKDRCDVKIGENRAWGDLTHYDVVFRGERLSVDLSLTNTVPAWRSQCGPIFFGDNEEYYFNWLPSVPEGDCVTDLTFDGKQMHLEGSGYHDHNWGNVSMLKLMHHWYWGRARIGDYKLISAWITAEKQYGYKEFDVFMLAKNGQILGDNDNHTLRFLPEGEYIDDYTGKPVYSKVVYEYETPAGENYRITFCRKGDIFREKFANRLMGPLRFVAKLIRFDAAYLRFQGTATVERLENGEVVETAAEDSAVWELMYFGKSGADKG